MKILSIDPGNIESGYTYIESNPFTILDFGKIANEDLLSYCFSYEYDYLAIEMVASYGMPVGQTIFDTCVWIGRFIQVANQRNIPYQQLYRKEIVTQLCGTSRAKDANVRRRLIDLYATHDFKNGKGTKSNPDILYGFKADIYSALAVHTVFVERLEHNTDSQTR